MPADQIIARQNIRIQTYVALLAVVLFIIKAAAYWLTHSMAVYTDMMESIVNIVAGFFGLYSLHFSAQPRDKKHPYGHGKIEFVSAFLEGSLITLAGAVIIFQVFTSFHKATAITSIDLGIGLIVITAVVNYAMGFLAVQKGRQTKSLALLASGQHLKTDTYSTIGIIIGLIVVKLTGFLWLDKMVALGFAAWIMIEGVKIIRQAFSGIMDEADMGLITELVAYLNQHRRDNWIDLHNLRVIKYGRILHIDAHLTVPGNLTVQQGHDEHEMLATLVKQKYGDSVELFVHLDPAGPDIHSTAEDWTMENVLKNRHHRF